MTARRRLTPIKVIKNKVDKTWKKYGLVEYPIEFNGQDIKRKILARDGKFIAVTSNQYKLLPNEEVLKVADRAAEVVGLVPFHEFTGNWFTRMDKNVITDPEGRVMHALYANNTPYEVNGDKMYLGVGVHNSIDASMGFGCGVFTFRNACANMVLAGMKGYHQDFDLRKTLDYVYKRHVGKNIDDLAIKLSTTIATMMDKSLEMLQWYRELSTEEVTHELAEKVGTKLPINILPPYLQPQKDAEGKKLPIETPTVSKWELYNDVTALIWHSDSTNMYRKTYQFNTLHRIMPVQAKVRKTGGF